MTDDLAPDFAVLASEARRHEPRVVGVSPLTSSDYKTVVALATAGVTTAQVGGLSDALKAFGRRRDLAAEILIANAAGAGSRERAGGAQGGAP